MHQRSLLSSWFHIHTVQCSTQVISRYILLSFLLCLSFVIILSNSWIHSVFLLVYIPIFKPFHNFCFVFMDLPIHSLFFIMYSYYSTLLLIPLNFNIYDNPLSRSEVTMQCLKRLVTKRSGQKKRGRVQGKECFSTGNKKRKPIVNLFYVVQSWS